MKTENGKARTQGRKETASRQGMPSRDARTQGKACHRHAIGKASARHQGKACRQGTQGIIGIGIIGIGNWHRHRQLASSALSSACHHRHHHRHADGMPSASAIAIIGMPSASAGRSSRTAGRSKVAQDSHTDFERVLRCAVVKIFE